MKFPHHAGLTLALLALLVGTACAERPAVATRRALESPASVTWRNAALAPAIRRLMAAWDVPLWIDRRVDPERRLTFAAPTQPLGDLLEELARSEGLGTAVIDGTVYLGPVTGARYLAATTPATLRGTTRSLRRRGDTSWPRLATPRQVVEELAAEAALTIDNPEAIPHDLWDAGEMTGLSVGDRLTLVLLGFDLRWSRQERFPSTIRIESIAYRPKVALARRQRSGNRGPAPNESEQRFTLRVNDQQAQSVLRQLAKQLGLEVVPESLPEGFAERRISFSVNQASLGELFNAVGEAAGVHVRLDGRRVVVSKIPD